MNQFHPAGFGDLVKAELRRPARELTSSQDAEIELRLDVRTQSGFGFPMGTKDSGVVRAVLFVNVATQAARLALSRTDHKPQDLERL